MSAIARTVRLDARVGSRKRQRGKPGPLQLARDNGLPFICHSTSRPGMVWREAPPSTRRPGWDVASYERRKRYLATQQTD